MRTSLTLLEGKLKLLPLALTRVLARLAFTSDTITLTTTRSYQTIRKTNYMNGEPRDKAKARVTNQTRGRSPVMIQKKPLHWLLERMKAVKQAKTNGDEAEAYIMSIFKNHAGKHQYLTLLPKHLLFE
jgi:hypothetical protein